MKVFTKKGSRLGKKKATNTVVTVGEIHKKRNLPLLVVVSTVVVGALILFGGYSLYHYHASHQVAGCDNQANDGVLHQSALALKPMSVSKLQTVVTKIKATPNYQQSPSCMAVLTSYYLTIGDANNAQASYNQLVKVYKPANGYDKIVQPYIKVPVQYKPLVDFLNAQAKSYQSTPVSKELIVQ